MSNSEPRQRSPTIEPAPTSSPNDAAADFADLPNLGLVKQRIREYYGDHVDADGRHQWSASSAWMSDVTAVTARARRHLRDRLAERPTNPALVLDVDDTALSTYPYLANTGFGARQNREVLPAIPPTLELALEAHGHDVTIFFVSVRLVERLHDTIANLGHVGYPEPIELFLRPSEPPFPSYMPSPSCSSAAFKTAVRAHIEAQGHRIVASLGDQDSDLRGGHADATFKLPNPMYHTP